MARPETLADIAVATLRRYKKRKWIDITSPFQSYFFNRLILKKKKDQVAGGLYLNFSVQYKEIDTFRDSGLYDDDSVGTANVLAQSNVPWYKAQASYMYDVDEPTFQGDDETKIIDLMQVKIHAMWMSFFKGMETRFWTAPTSASTNPAEFYGIPSYVVQSSTAAFGFNGGDATPFSGTGVGGLVRTTYTGLKNGTFTYQTISDEDGLDKLAEAMDKCNFEQPHDFEQLDGMEPDYGLYTTYTVKRKCEKLVKAQNDNLGRDLWKGRPLFKSCPIEWVPALTNQYIGRGSTTQSNPAYDSSNPIYGINWNTTRVVFNEGCNQRITKPIRRAGKHNVFDVFLDTSLQMEVRDTYTCFVGKAA